MGRCIMTSHVVKYLSLNIYQQPTSTYTEKIRLRPIISKLLFHQNHPQYGILRSANTTSWLETHLKPPSKYNMLISSILALGKLLCITQNLFLKPLNEPTRSSSDDSRKI